MNNPEPKKKNWWEAIPNYPDIGQVRLKEIDWAEVERQIFRDASEGRFQNHIEHLDHLTKVVVADNSSLAHLYLCLLIVNQKKFG